MLPQPRSPQRKNVATYTELRSHCDSYQRQCCITTILRVGFRRTEHRPTRSAPFSLQRRRYRNSRWPSETSVLAEPATGHDEVRMEIRRTKLYTSSHNHEAHRNQVDGRAATAACKEEGP